MFCGGNGSSTRFSVEPGAIVRTVPSFCASCTKNRLVERCPISISLPPGPALPSIICTTAGAFDALCALSKIRRAGSVPGL